ncbi:hypothetical protein RvY_12613 [Ramazzottius varieornatus]|uniref:Peptidase S1 domain-containing protein n=1 Tax=Ramazzottius varieornatus TaxID=947166 RepID=A0A1D1VM33_RAMVA|nr:hypothetical protein RvY_12613 [Ramazzottius varieornatus]
MASIDVLLMSSLLLSAGPIDATKAGNKCGLAGGSLKDPFGLRGQFLQSTIQAANPTTLSALDTNNIAGGRAAAVVSSADRLNTSLMSFVDIPAATTASPTSPLALVVSAVRGSSGILDGGSVNEAGTGRRRVIPRSLDQPQAGQRQLLDKVSGGTQAAQPGQLCWQVKVNLLSRISPGRYSVSSCGGVIIGPSTILTAAHCLTNPIAGSSRSAVSAEDISVHTGDWATSSCNNAEPPSCSADHSVRNLTIHPAYKATVSDNDLALLSLDKAVNLADQCNCALCLRNASPAIGQSCIVSGSGDDLAMSDLTSFTAPRWAPLTIRQASLTTSACGFNIDEETGQPTDLDLFLCAGGLPTERSCQGDSGGPLVCYDFSSASHYLAGVYSFGPPCGLNIGAMYSSIVKYLDWIVTSSNGDVTLA